MRNTIAVAGNMIIDKIKLLRTFPARHELTGILSVEESLGGAACNVGMDLARLDPSLPVRVFGVAGADADGDKVLRAFGAFPNIDVSRVRRRGQSSFTDVLTEVQGRARTFLTFGGSNADFRETDVEADALSDVKLFHIGYILLLDALDAPDDEYGTKMARLLHNVQAAGALTSVDVV
ncbi:MAG: carbohydrate kinase family protein, partial [Clostridia bacterium]|nr:carbohydrate kinase family protein [Clostridia bacterium]